MKANVDSSAFGLLWTVTSAALKIFTSPRLLSLYLAPLLSGLLTLIGLLTVFWTNISEITAHLSSYLPDWLSLPTSIMVFILTLPVSTVAAVLVMNVAGAFFIEMLIDSALKSGGVTPDQPENFITVLRSTIRALRDDLVRIIVFFILTLFATLLAVFPPLSALPFLVGLFLLGYNMYDLPLALAGFCLKERLYISFKHATEVLLMGTVFSLMLVAPFGGLLFLPVGYYAAAERVAGWLNHSRP
ncbi:MAG: hypothetical protein D6719_00100 [Candidatus Dadabacteria bacterium]|nr:MAG: hypothetical protein D6719_00100 [Candidatus Dadabacteria bacterium]